MLRPTAVKAEAQNDFYIKIEFDNGDIKLFDVRPYIKGSWYGKLSDVEYFQQVKVDGFTVTWPDGQDLCPDEIFELGVKIG